MWERVVVRGAYLLLLAVPVVHWFPHKIADPILGALIPQAHAALALLIWFVWRIGWSPGSLRQA